MKTAEELCKQIEQDKKDQIENDYKDILRRIRENGESCTSHQWKYARSYSYETIVTHEERLKKAGFKVEYTKNPDSKFKRWFAAADWDMKVTVSACCGKEEQMKYLTVLLILLSPVIISANISPEVIGKAEYCAVSKYEVWCVSHEFTPCLAVLWDLRDGTECVKNEGQFK